MTTGVKHIDPGDLCVKCGRCCYFKGSAHRPCPFLTSDNLCSIYPLRKVVYWCVDPVAATLAGDDVLPHDCPVYLEIRRQQ